MYERLQKVHVTTSHEVMVRLLMKLGEVHDEQVKMWQESLTTALSLDQVHICSLYDNSKRISVCDTVCINSLPFYPPLSPSLTLPPSLTFPPSHSPSLYI